MRGSWLMLIKSIVEWKTIASEIGTNITCIFYKNKCVHHCVLQFIICVFQEEEEEENPFSACLYSFIVCKCLFLVLLLLSTWVLYILWMCCLFGKLQRHWKLLQSLYEIVWECVCVCVFRKHFHLTLDVKLNTLD